MPGVKSVSVLLMGATSDGKSVSELPSVGVPDIK